MPADDPSPHSWLRRFKVEVAFLGLLAAAAIGGAFYIRHVEYVGGTKNVGTEGIFAFMTIYGVLGLASLGFIMWQFIQLFRRPRVGRGAFLIAPPIILVAGFMVMRPLTTPFLDGFEQWVLRDVDTDAIQQWVATEGHKYTFQKYMGVVGPAEKLPDVIVRLKPTMIWFPDPASEGGLCVILGWGGALRGWHVVVGLSDMPMPKETGCRRSIKPGVYIAEE
jgi:hypothetical protein